VSESGTLAETVNNDNWGTAGATTSIDTHLRFKIDDSDSSIAYLQADLDIDFIGGFVTGIGSTPEGGDIDILSI
jgi:hypothetical protein